jgi:hypothetical protein
MSDKRVSEMTDDEIRDLAGSGRSPEYSVKDAADRAAEAVRLLNYLTLPGDGAPGLEYPSNVYDIVASIKIAVQRMPQLFGQMSGWLAGQYEADKVGHDGGEDARKDVDSTRHWLEAAANLAGELEAVLNSAHTASAHLTGKDG